MPITFAPIRAARRDGSNDLIVSLRRNADGVPSLELVLSSVAMERVRYVDGDRVIAHYDEANKAWTLERISASRTSDGYKVQVRESSGGNTSVIRLGCSEEQVKVVMGDEKKVRLDFLEINGNRATFVLCE